MAPTPLPILTTVHSRHKSLGPSRFAVNSNDDLQARLYINSHYSDSYSAPLPRLTIAWVKAVLCPAQWRHVSGPVH